MRGVAGIPPPEIDVRDISIQVQFLAFPQIGVAVVVGVGGEDFPAKYSAPCPRLWRFSRAPSSIGGPWV